MTATLPDKGFVRLRQIIGTKDKPGPIPVSKATWYLGMKDGRFPRPVHPFGPSVAVWNAKDIHHLIDTAANDAEVGHE